MIDDAGLDEILKTNNVQSKSSATDAWADFGLPPVKPETTMDKVFGTTKAVLGGIGEGAGGIALTGLDKVAEMAGHPTDLHKQWQDQFGAEEHPAAYGGGRLGGEIASLAAPVGSVGKAVGKGMKAAGVGNKVSKVVQAGAEGVAFTAGQAAQEGESQSLEDYAVNAGINAAFPVAGMVMKGLADTVAPRIINSLIKPLAKDFAYGKDPGKAVAELGITGNSFDDLIKNISSKKEEVGQSIGKVISQTQTPERIDLAQALKSIDDALVIANKTPRTNATLIDRLQSVKDDIADNFGDGSIQSAQNLKKTVGDLTKWTGNASDDATVNKSLKGVYGAIVNKMDQSLQKVLSPEDFASYKKATEQYGSLMSAENAAIYRDKINERQNMISFGAKNAGLIGALGTAIATGGAAVPTLLAGLGVAALDKAAATPFFKTNLAKLLVKMAPDEVKTFFEKIPTAKSLFDKSQIDDLINKKSIIGSTAAATTLAGASATEDKNGITSQEDFMKQYPDGINKKKEEPVTSVAKTPDEPVYKVREGKVKVSDNDIEELGAILFGEVGNRNFEKKLLEAKVIANIALNRAQKEGKTLREVLRAPKQFQALNGKQYNLYKTREAHKNATSTEKIKAIEKVLEEIKKGTLANTVGDNLSYAHRKDETIRVYKDWNEQKKDIHNIK